MDTALFDEVAKQTPDLTRELAEGLAFGQLTRLKRMGVDGTMSVSTVNEQYINMLFMQTAKSFPPNLKYLGYERVTPEDEYRILSNKKKDGRFHYDTSRSDVYMLCYNFSIVDQVGVEKIIPVYLYLPYARRGGIVQIKNAKFMISPVIADVGLSISSNGIFLMGTRFRLTFDKISAGVYIDNQKITEYIMWSQVYNVKDARNTKTTLPHYLFCKYGVIETFKWFGLTPTFMSAKDLKEDRNSENPKYPEEDYLTIRPCGRRLSKRSTQVKPVTDVVMVLPREQEGYHARTLACAFYYIADLFPDKITMLDFDNIRTWRRLLGKVLFGLGESEGKIINQINTHMQSNDEAIDSMVETWLAEGGYPGIDNFYKLFKLIIEKGPTLLATGGEHIASLYGKRYTINRYVNDDIIRGITNLMHQVKKQASTGKIMRKEEVQKHFNTYLPVGLALRLNRDHPEVRSVSTASDCLIYKVTSSTLMQTSATTSGSSGPSFGPDKVLDMSISEGGGHSNQPDRDPSGRSSINMCVKIDAQGTILRNPKFIPMMDKYQAMIKR